MGRLFPNLMLDEYQEKAFYNALKTKGFVILAGLSGTGKTRIFDELVDNFYRLKLPEAKLDASLVDSINIFKAKQYRDRETKINDKSLTKIDWHYHGGIVFDLGFRERGSENKPHPLILSQLCRKYLGLKGIQIENKSSPSQYSDDEVQMYANIFGIFNKEYFSDNGDFVYNISLNNLANNTDKLKKLNDDIYSIKKLAEAGNFLPIISNCSLFDAFSLPVRKIFAFIFNPDAWMYIFDKDEINKLSDSLFGLSNAAPKLILKKVEIPSLFLPIRPDFRDSKSLIGYYNPLDESYHSTELLDFILEAQREYIKAKKVEKENEVKAEGGKNGERKHARPYFVLLDEMNLARVEYYFADFLSVLESRKIDEEYIKNNKDKLKEMRKNLSLGDGGSNAIKGFYSAPILLYSENDITSDRKNKITSKKKNKIPQKLYIPPNLYFVGTVNIDETTHMFSPKVLDRVFTLEFDSNIGDYKDHLLSNKQQEQTLLIVDDFTRGFNYAKIDLEYIKLFLEIDSKYDGELIKISDILKLYSLHFGNRVYNEVMMFTSNAKYGIYVGKKPAGAGNNNLIEIDGLDIEEFSGCEEAFDLAVRMKILPKFHGTKQALEVPIMKLISEFCKVETAGQQQQQQKIVYSDKTKKLQLKGNDLDILEMPVLEVDKSSGVPKLKISGNEYTAKYPHTACKLFEMLYKLSTNGFASFL